MLPLFEKHISVKFIFSIIYRLETTQNRKVEIFLFYVRKSSFIINVRYSGVLTRILTRFISY